VHKCRTIMDDAVTTLLPVLDIVAMNTMFHCGENHEDAVCWHRNVREVCGGGSRKVSGRSSYLHTPSKNSNQISWIQAYIARHLGRSIFEGSALLGLENDLCSGFRNPWQLILR